MEAHSSPPPVPADLCGEIAAIFRRAWGRGPQRTTAHWAGGDTILVLLENGFNDAERALHSAGHAAHVAAGRNLMHEIVEPELATAVAQATGRAVHKTLCALHPDDVCALVFLLERG